MSIPTQPYLAQTAKWPQTGRHILAQFDETTVVVYQAYCREIGDYAVRHGHFGGPFSLNRMSWIKPNFLWMMYRCGWGTKVNQEVTLAIRLYRSAFDEILRQAVHSTFVPEVYGTPERWQQEVATSCVRVQWDPDHDPSGTPLQRRALQLGLRGEILAKYAKEWIASIEDMSSFVSTQAGHASPPYADLITPSEDVYPVSDAQTAKRLGIDGTGQS
jgi:hypothetical protein